MFDTHGVYSRNRLFGERRKFLLFFLLVFIEIRLKFVTYIWFNLVLRRFKNHMRSFFSLTMDLTK